MNSMDPEFFDNMMTHVMEFEGFTRMEYEADFPLLLPPQETHRPFPPTYEQVMEKGEGYWNYPLHLKQYEKKCYETFLKWNRKCLEQQSNTELNHLVWLVGKMEKCSLKIMDEESGACFTACNFFFDQNKKLVITNPR
jgi:hypothetical protein